jgi:hypothetical protein
MLMESNYPLGLDMEATYEDFAIVGAQASGWQSATILKKYRVLPYSASPVCCKEVPPWNPPSIF